MQRVLVTGVDGFIGRHVAALFSRAGYEVHGIVRTAPTSPLQVRALHEADLRDPSSVRRAVSAARPDVVIHLASVRRTSGTGGTIELIAGNVLAAASVMSALDDRPSTRMMYASTAAVYQAQPEVSLTEGSIVRPASAYGAAKAATEILVQQFGDGRVAATTILRLSNVIGPGQPEDLAASAFAVQVARAERRGVSGVLHHGRLDDARDFIDVRDVAAAFLEAAALSDAGTAIYNVGTGEAVPLSRVLDVLIGSSTAEIRGEPDEAIVRGGPRSSVVLDARAFRERTGWRPTIALERSLIDTLDHWRTTLT